MPATRYQKAIRVLEDYMKRTKKNYIYTLKLRQLIIVGIGSTENTVFQTLAMLREMEVIKEIEKNKWEIKI